MARLPRVVAVGIPHHVTQRGNARQFLLTTDVERSVYLALLRQAADFRGLSVLGYCLMSNHVHLIAIPQFPDSLALTLKQTHGRYASYWNASCHSSGHVWQGRFYSCPLDPEHLWKAMRYTELNPVRGELVNEALAWPWSSALAHCTPTTADNWLDMRLWRSRWGPQQWHEYLRAGETQNERIAIRRCTHSGRPLGEASFVEQLEHSMQRRLAPAKRGRPSLQSKSDVKESLMFSH